MARQVLGAEAALLLAVATGLGAELVAGPSVPLALHVAVTSLAASGLAGQDGRRGGLWRAGLAAGLAGAALAAAAALHGGKGLHEVLAVSGASLAGGGAAPAGGGLAGAPAGPGAVSATSPGAACSSSPA